ncbi:MOSC domain-containing protein [bacterium]|nr:MOSC domain-containing protein [Candidatus Omnitrophota bacterium]MBU2528392.1 MOSC domain-containing protein [bacterium]MBU3930650.1 MOSC domain-containing protein [bacterium]MBU4122329.1 MOSC domain-containing protein [bacterium]
MVEKNGKIISIRISVRKGVKENRVEGYLRENYGFEGDIHGGPGERQVSLFIKESLDKLKRDGVKIGCAGFGENLMVSGVAFSDLTPGTNLKAGDAVLKITQTGKICRKPCGLYDSVEDCRLSKLGIFAEVIKGGGLKIGDAVEVLDGV